MNAKTDQQLLQDYARSHSEPAFAELVRRHIDLVYSAALRMVCDSHQAEDVTQGVFVALAQNARQLTHHPVLSGWLHCTAQNLAANAVRTNVRRQTREQEAVVMNELLSAEPDANWENIAPHLDAALGELSEADRDALLLRYFERKSAREMAQTLGISDEAAQKRVSRAVERLREFFAKRGVTVGVSGLVVVISANAVQAAPVGLAITISTATAITGTTIATTATATTIKTIAMTTLQKTIIAAVLVAAVGTAIYEVQQASLVEPSTKPTSKSNTVAEIIIKNIGPQVNSREQVRSNILIKVGDAYGRSNADANVRVLYESGLFSNIRVTEQKTDEGVILTYFLQDRPTLADIRVRGNTKHTTAELVKNWLARLEILWMNENFSLIARNCKNFTANQATRIHGSNM